MSPPPLPSRVDLRRLVASRAAISASQPLAALERLRAAVTDATGNAEIALQFGVDERGLKLCDGEVSCEVQVICQRCLKPMPLALASTFTLALVWSDDEARALPGDVDPLIVGEEPMDLREVIEDELLVALPIVAFHDETECSASGHYSSAPPPSELVEAAPADNPFNVLERLKSSE